MSETESIMAWRSLGGESAAWIEATGDRWYMALFEFSGVHDAVRDFVVPTEQEVARSRGLEGLGQSVVFPYLETCVEGLFHSLRTLCWRLATLVVWLPLAPMVAVPALIDGMLRWRIRQYTFDYASPLVHTVAIKGILGMFLFLPFYLFLPVPLSPWVPPLAMMGAALLLAVTAAHTQKRI